MHARAQTHTCTHNHTYSLTYIHSCTYCMYMGWKQCTRGGDDLECYSVNFTHQTRGSLGAQASIALSINYTILHRLYKVYIGHSRGQKGHNVIMCDVNVPPHVVTTVTWVSAALCIPVSEQHSCFLLSSFSIVLLSRSRHAHIMEHWFIFVFNSHDDKAHWALFRFVYR